MTYSGGQTNAESLEVHIMTSCSCCLWSKLSYLLLGTSHWDDAAFPALREAALHETTPKCAAPLSAPLNVWSLQVMLASKLMPCLTAAATRTGSSARIVNHSSMARHGVNVDPGHYKVVEANSLGGDKARWTRYSQTKFANACWVQALKVCISPHLLTFYTPSAAPQSNSQ